jgi:septal ring factor EnvC (AmiA/AmiB activator)
VDSKRRDLEQMESELQDLELDLQARRDSRAVLEAELEGLERDVAQLARAGHQLDAMIDEQVRAVEGLQAELAAERGRLEQERRSIAALLRSAYAFGGSEHLRMLLDQEDMARVSRVMSYYGFLNRYRLRRLRAFSDQARRLEGLRLAAAEETQRLAMLAARQEDTRGRLARAQGQRTELLAELRRTIASREERYDALREEAEGLRSLVEQLERQAAILPEADFGQQPIAELRGRLAWPLGDGELLERFGRLKGESGQRWDGVLLAAPEGTEVRAVHHGRVAYADWLRGFGLLIIIEHDDGYMSLYGHNQTMLKESGEWVGGGETIALSGASGGQQRPGLYFAIRHRGRPLDPERWCRAATEPGQVGPSAGGASPPGERRALYPIQIAAVARASTPTPVAAR